MRSITIDGKVINETRPPYFIAEIGHNHGGDLDVCKRMFEAAKINGASAVKLQKRTNDKLFMKRLYDAPYDNENSFGRTFGEHREALEFDWDQYWELKDCAERLGITFFATAFDPWAADFLADLDMPAFKVASGDIKNLPLLKHIDGYGRPMIISTGGAVIEDVLGAMDTIKYSPVAFLYCVAKYPCEIADLDFNVISEWNHLFPDVVFGFSDHSTTIITPVLAYDKGALIIERHFTLNRSAKGTDHPFSLEPHGLSQVVKYLRYSHETRGNGIKRPLPGEEGPLKKMGKALWLNRDMKAGETITVNDIQIKSPMAKIGPERLGEVLGKQLLVDGSSALELDWEHLI